MISSKPQQNTFSAPARTAFTPYSPGRDDKKRQSTENRRKSFKFTPESSPHRTALFPPHINAAPLALDYSTLNLLRQNHPAWNLLCTRHAPLVAVFLHQLFIVPNVQILSQADLIKAFIDTQWLADFDNRLDKYLAAAGKTDGERR